MFTTCPCSKFVTKARLKTNVISFSNFLNFQREDKLCMRWLVCDSHRSYFSVVLPTLCGLGISMCGLRNLTVWAAFFFFDSMLYIPVRISGIQSYFKDPGMSKSQELPGAPPPWPAEGLSVPQTSALMSNDLPSVIACVLPHAIHSI